LLSFFFVLSSLARTLSTARKPTNNLAGDRWKLADKRSFSKVPSETTHPRTKAIRL